MLPTISCRLRSSGICILDVMEDSTPACSYSTSPEKIPEDEDPTVDCPHSTDERCDQSAKSNNIRLPDVLATSLGDQSK